MRLESAAAAKRKNGYACQLKPREGTKIRAIYDLFMASKGIPIDVALCTLDRNNSKRIADLRDFYGLDIRNIKNGCWVLAGEWIGKIYVDYIADRLAKLDREARQ